MGSGTSLLCCHCSAFHGITALLPYPTSHSAHPHPISNVSHPIAQIQPPNMAHLHPTGQIPYPASLIPHPYPPSNPEQPTPPLPHILITPCPDYSATHRPIPAHPIPQGTHMAFSNPKCCTSDFSTSLFPLPLGNALPHSHSQGLPAALSSASHPKDVGVEQPQTGNRSALWDEPMPSSPAVPGKDADLPLVPLSPPCCCP